MCREQVQARLKLGARQVPVSELVAAANNPLTAAPAPLQEAIQRGGAVVSFPPASERAAATTSYVYPPVAEVCACVGVASPS